MRSLMIFVGIAFLGGSAFVGAAEAAYRAQLYKSPECECCEGYADYLRQNGFDVSIEATPDLYPMKQRLGVPGSLEGCHTTLIEGYVIEGHVPIAAIRRLLADRPVITGISLPDMPLGSPGMNGEKSEPFVILEITPDGGGWVFAVE